MARYLILEDDFVISKLWQSLIRQMDPGAQVTTFPSLSALRKSRADSPGVFYNFDFFICDIFLSGDETGLDFVKSLPKNLQKKTILTSATSRRRGKDLLRANHLVAYFVSKPVDLAEARKVLQLITGIVSETSERPALVRIKRKSHRPVFFITGANSGIGLELVKILARESYYRVAITARGDGVELLKKIFGAQENVKIIEMDLTRVDDVNRAVDQVLVEWKSIDVLVNNAGVCFRGVIEQMDTATEIEQMQTNYLGPMALIRAVVPTMREMGRGKIINISSASGVIGMPTMGSYSASKHALEGASESLWQELKPFGISVTIVRPGFVNSEGYKRTRRTRKGALSEFLGGPFSDLQYYMTSWIGRAMNRAPSTSESVARRIVSVIQMQHPPFVCYGTFDAWLLNFAKRILPSNALMLLIFIFFTSQFNWAREHSHAQPKRLGWVDNFARRLSRWRAILLSSWHTAR
jgi:short-subunit dehydrogenase